MRSTVRLILGGLLLPLSTMAAGPNPNADRVIWTDQLSRASSTNSVPQKFWQNDGYPLGNGRLGCMVYGGLPTDRIMFNVDSLWTGDENPSGNYKGRHSSFGAYQNFGNLYIDFDRGARAEGYRRTLDIENASCSVRYAQDNVNFEREYFCSHPDQVIAARYTADKEGQYSGRIRLMGAHEETTTVDGNRMTITGTLTNGLHHEAQLLVLAEGGKLKADGGDLVFSECDSLTLYLAADTSFVMDYDRKFLGEHPRPRVTESVDRAAASSFEELRQRHVKDYRKLYDRVSIDIGTTAPEQLALPMANRLKAIRDNNTPDPDLEELLFQYGRYLLISCSRPGALPANLQGLWNDRNNPRWLSDYHSNINLQMNYWGAQPANLAECHGPLFDMLSEHVEPFRKATRAEFGEDVRGFTIRTSHNPFGGGGWHWNIPASAWYARHFWENYAYNGDREFLEKVAYPFLKEVCHYWEDHLKELPDGTLVAPNGWSPEHGPKEDGVAHDQQIIWDLFSNTIKASEALGVDEDYRATLTDLRDRLDGPKIGRWGQLQEWREDRDDPENEHRHTSHLYAVFPGYQISRTKTPEFAEAAAVSLKARGESGDSRREWAWTWRCALWARLGNAEMSHHMIRSFFKYNMLDNLIGTHPPLQLDGSLGITGSISEMLIQSHAGEVQLLPALPKAWATGSVKGLRARGGFTVDMAWQEGNLVEARIRADRDGDCIVRYGDQTKTISLEGGKPGTYTPGLDLEAAKETPVGEDGLEEDPGAAVVTGKKALSDLERRMAWWEEARFALFIHWGAYSVLGGEYGGRDLAGAYAEQIQRKLKISADEYLEHAARPFRPEPFDAEEWVLLAKNAGMKYVVITAKHHDGFGIYHSKHSDFDVEDTSGWDRDPLKELSDACKKHGLIFGVYYSQSQDWRDAFDPSGDWDAPGNPASARYWWNEEKFPNVKVNRENFDRYVHEKAVPQVIELIEDYGVKMIWFDTPAAYPAEYARVFLDAVRKTDPDIVVNSRIGGGKGDYRGGPDSPVVFSYTRDRYWEAIQSTLHSWGYNKFDEGNRRPFDYLLRMLATVVSKGGNMMINVGPKPDGSLVAKDVETLEDFADWSADHILSIRGAGRSPLPPQNWGVVTSKDRALYLHVFDWPKDGVLRVGGLKSAPVSARTMKGEAPLTFSMEKDRVLYVNVPDQPIHPVNSVIELRFNEAPAGDANRLLEPGLENRFHITDTPHIVGKELKYPNGVGFRAFLDNWTDPEAKVTWKVRAAEEGDYEVSVLYDHAGIGDDYQVRIGDQVLKGVVNAKGTGDDRYVEREIELMRMHQRGRGRMVVDALGSVRLKPGVYDMILQSVGEIENGRLFLPRAVLLTPEKP